jgi:hypothetical protein
MGEYISDVLCKKIAESGNVTITPEQLAIIAEQVPQQDLTGLVEAVTGKSLVSDTEIAKIHAANSDNQDISGKVDKVTNKSLVLDTEIAKTHSSGSDNQDLSGYNLKRLLVSLTAPVASSGTTEKVLLQLQIPAARAVVGSIFRAWIVGNSSSTGTLIFRIKCGANGTISDTEDWKSVTSAAQAANARAGFECLITVRSATTIAVDGVGYAGAIQLPTTIAVPATPAIAIANQWYINMTVVCSSGTFTAQVGSIEEIR